MTSKSDPFAEFIYLSDGSDSKSQAAPAIKHVQTKPELKTKPKKKSIILSEDEDEDEEEGEKEKQPKQRKQQQSSKDDWLESRDPKTLSSRARNDNIFRAKQVHQKPKIAKTPKRKFEDDSEEDDDLIDTPGTKVYNMFERDKIKQVFNKKPAFNSMLIKSTLDEIDVDEHVERAQQRKAESRSNRVESRGMQQKNSMLFEAENPPIKKKREEEPIMVNSDSGTDEIGSDTDDDDDDNNDDEMGSDVELDEAQMSSEADKVIKACESVSANLRKSLNLWQCGNDDSSNSSVTNGKDCIDLIAITGGQESLLRDQDIKELCPGLVLKAYQLVGVNWLKLLHQNNVNGVLADDMGLGKTVQTIAFLGWLEHSAAPTSIHRPHLVVVPASTLANWQNEFARFCPSLNVVTYHGSQKERQQLKV